jgi:predicted DNA-binding protein
MKNKRFEKGIFIRLPNELYILLKEVAEKRGEDMSTFTRRAILKELAELELLNEEHKKFLGVI